MDLTNEKKLAWFRDDIECKCGFSGQKFTGVNIFFSVLLGLALTALFYGLLLTVYDADQDRWMIDMFFNCKNDRSIIPYFTVFFSCWSLAVLIIKLLKLRLQEKALKVDILPEDCNFVLTSHTAEQIISRMHHEVADPAHFILLDRIERALSNLRNLGNVSAVSECLKNQAENDENCLSSSYTVLKGFVWAIPVLGFIGTVLGLSNAVGSFGNVVKSSSDIQEIKAALSQVTGGLGVAFETTLIALVLALIIQIFITFTLHKEEKFLDDCSDYCHKNIISKMKNISTSDSGE